MRLVLQRVTNASVSIGGKKVAEIGRGILVLACVERGDDEAIIRWTAEKTRSLRIFEDEAGRMNHSVEEIGGEILVVSQFTLASRIAKGRRPGFELAEEPARAATLFERFLVHLREGSAPVKSGIFRAMMSVSLTNDGPVTFIIERPGAEAAH